ncbi:MAG: T9SS type A sorting domain-containing protein [Bacteroidales bacterium]
MRKKLSLLGLLLISNFLIFGQTLTVKPSTIQTVNAEEIQNQSENFNKKQVSNSKAIIWSSNMATASQWTVTKLADQSANIVNSWEWKADTAALSTFWKFYVGPYMGSTTPMQGVFYFDGITNLVNSNYGTTNTTLKNTNAISTLGHPFVNIKFYQLYKAFNADSTFLEISSDNVNWTSIDVNPSVSVNTYAYGWKELNISQWAGNKAQLWIRFRFYGPSSTTSGAQYGGGYGWAIDDVHLFDPSNNNLIVNRATFYDGYTKIPSGLAMPMYYDADIMNMGGLSQTNVKLHGVELNTGIDSTSLPTTLLPGQNLLDFPIQNYFTIPATTLGTYKVMSYLSSDSIPFILAQDTFDVKIVCDTCMYSRDNNTYTGSRWAGVTGTTSDPYAAVSRFQVKNDRMAYGVNCVVNKETKVGSKIKAVLYKYYTATATRTIVAQSANYYIAASDIPSSIPMQNPPSINLSFTSGYTMQTDSMYWVGIQVYGGTDTVKIATDNTGVPQPSQSSLYFDPMVNNWYIWENGNVPALMIRTLFSPYVSLLPGNAGTITGTFTICQGQNNVTYTVPAIQNATSYIWTLPTGASGSSTTNSITVNYSSSALSGYITVKGVNSYGNGAASSMAVIVSSIPANAGIISGTSSVLAGQINVVYSVPAILNATSYIWSYSGTGLTIIGNNNIVNIAFSTNALSGNLSVKGVNSCGNGVISYLYITVNPVVPNCSAQFNMQADTIPHVYYVVNNASGVAPLHFYWSWGDGTHDTIALPNHTYSSAGNYNICLKVTDANNCTITYCDSSFLQKSGNTMISVSVIPGTFLGIDSHILSGKISLFPNPATDILSIDLRQLSMLQNTTIAIYDIQGKLLLQQPLTQALTELNISSFAKGIYVVKIKNDKQSLVSKFIKE